MAEAPGGRRPSSYLHPAEVPTVSPPAERSEAGAPRGAPASLRSAGGETVGTSAGCRYDDGRRPPGASAMSYDLVIANGTALSAERTQTADVAVRGERIAAVGPGLA